MPDALHVTITYDKNLQRITEKETEPMITSRGSTFSYVLMNIFMAYPEIETTYEPGVLGFTVDGKAPQMDTQILDGDIISFLVK